MSEERYKILFNGMVMIETPEETVKANLARLFKCDLSRIESLFDGQTVVLKHNLTAQEAERYMLVLREAGAIVYRERDELPKPAAPPVPLAAPVAKPEAKAVEASPASKPVENPRDRTLGDPFGGAPVRSQDPTYMSPTRELAELRQQGRGAYCEIDFISLSGRLGRIRYLGWSWIFCLPFALPAGVLEALPPSLLTFGAVVLGIAWLVTGFMWTLRRLHDINMSGWWMLLILVPPINILFLLFLSLKSGDDSENDYGLPPPPNGAFVCFLACVMLLLSVVSVWGSISEIREEISELKEISELYDSDELTDQQGVRVSEEQIEQITQLLRDSEFSKFSEEQIKQVELRLRRGQVPEKQVKMLLREAERQRGSR
jgi:uncharacterized membrane protein YhaH (DUF805 family)